MSWALKGSRFASSEPAGIEMMKGWTCESPNAGTSREADGDETGGEERQEYQAEGRGRGPPWEKAGSLRVLELDPMEGASEHTVQAGGGEVTSPERDTEAKWESQGGWGGSRQHGCEKAEARETER